VAETPLDHLQSVLLHLLFKHAIPGRIDRLLSGVSADTAFGGASQFQWSQPPSLGRRFFSLPPAHLALRLLGQRWTKAQQLSASITEMQGLGLPITDPQSPAWGVGAYGDFDWVQTHYGASREDVISFRRSLLRPYLDRPFDDVFVIYYLNFSGTGAEVWSKLAEGQRKILYCPFESKELDAAFSIPWEIKFKNSRIRSILSGEWGKNWACPSLPWLVPRKALASSRTNGQNKAAHWTRRSPLLPKCRHQATSHVAGNRAE
jgi:asparagine synthetase B (glutamine-hydrolysing)